MCSVDEVQIAQGKGQFWEWILHIFKRKQHYALGDYRTLKFFLVFVDKLHRI